MKRDRRFINLAKAVLLIIFFVLQGCISDSGIQTDMSYSHLKAISLKALQEKIFEFDPQEITKMKSFYGINRLYGFMWDTEGEDLILFGEADPKKPTLYFDDFVVSLRNAYCFYCKKEGNTLYYSMPSVTIDPDPRTIKLMNSLNDDISKGNEETRAQRWQGLCMEPQKVGVFGIPFNSHLASVMVNADYIMKDVANGNYEINIQGDFKSLHQMRKERVEEAMRNGSEIRQGSPLNRFEFTAPEAFFKTSDNLFLHYFQPVILITEEEHLAGNSITGTGKTDPLARQFAENFNRKYREISKEVPIYETLWEAYRVFAIAQEIKESNLVIDTSFFSAIFYNYPLDEVSVPTTLPGRSMVDQLTFSTENGYSTHYLYSCGGVNLGSKPKRTLIKKLKSNEIMHSIIGSKPNPNAVSWEATKVSSESWVLNIRGHNFIIN